MTPASPPIRDPTLIDGARMVVRRPLSLLSVLALPVPLLILGLASGYGWLAGSAVVLLVVCFVGAASDARARRIFLLFAATEHLEYARRRFPPPFGLPRVATILYPYPSGSFVMLNAIRRMI